MKLLIEYNKAIDFLNAIMKYCSYCLEDDVRNKSNNAHFDNFIDFSPSMQIKNWLKFVDSEISPFLKSDLLLLTYKVLGFGDTFAEIILSNNIAEPEALINTVSEMSDDSLIKTLYKYYNNVGISFEEDCKTLVDSLSKLYDEETANIYIQIRRFPSEYKSKIVNLFDKFYKAFVKPYEEYVSSFMNEKIELHNKKIKSDPIGFLNIIGIGDYSKAIKDTSSIRIFISYYIDLGFFYTNINNTFFILYGFYMEERFNQQIMQDKYKNLFKALSDEKRLEIIRLTSKRPWYNKELADYFGLTTATLSYHLNLLLDLGILNFDPSDSNRYYYTTNKENLKALLEYSLDDLTASN
ncbi:ArsR family transcriptional regulator [Lutispora sp.]|uniref:ArsR family transcriptional regulator n=1 Tax=Lutispora sp. TaxID=2828727 RepID=UPI000EC805B3|nr:ArsR family transcriptional regulator [Lutispora sp.]MEA4963380.1 ArsR family transcriptional regulator [Lutispora sp.]HCJ56765.1 hypothetical protein [Clostridiaceae bacterium]